MLLWQRISTRSPDRQFTVSHINGINPDDLITDDDPATNNGRERHRDMQLGVQGGDLSEQGRGRRPVATPPISKFSTGSARLQMIVD